MLHISFVTNLLDYILPCWLFCMLCYRGRAVVNVGRTCSPTPLFVQYIYTEAIKYVYTTRFIQKVPGLGGYLIKLTSFHFDISYTHFSSQF